MYNSSDLSQMKSMNHCYVFESLKNQLLSKWNLVFSKNNGTAWISFKPQLGLHVYPCYACRDMFVSKVTFQDHTNRRAIMIKYDCAECNLTLTFYNRCSFLLHARSHFSLAEGKIDLNHIEIYSLPFGMMGFLPHPGIDLLFDVEEDLIEENCYINTQFYSPDISEQGKQIITLKPNDLLFCSAGTNSIMKQLTLKQISKNIPLCQFVNVDCQKELRQKFAYSGRLKTVKQEVVESNNSEPSPPPAENSIQIPVISKIESLSSDMSTYPRCPECEQTQRCSMKMHFVGKNVPLDENLKCSLCKYVASTKCSHLAHERIHSNLSPFICPECGKKFEFREYLMKHLDDVCFHLSKQVRIRCPGKKCGKLFASTTTFSIHFAQHIHTWMQCTVCKECFESVIAFSEHAKIHSNLCFSDKVFKCLGCKNNDSIIYQDDLKQHLDYHTGDRTRYMYVFLCKFCRNYFRSTTTYAAHLLKCQKMQAMIQQGYSYSVDFCVQCHNRIIFYDNENFVSCTKCRCINSFFSSQKSINNINPVEKQGNQSNSSDSVNICLLCKEEYLSIHKEEHLSNCMYRSPQIEINKLEHESSHSLFSHSDSSNEFSLEYENDVKILKKSSSSDSEIKDTSMQNAEVYDCLESARETASPSKQKVLRKKRKGRKPSSESDIKEAPMEGTETNSSPGSATKTSPNSQEGFKRKRKKASFVFRTKRVGLSSPSDNIIDLQAEEAKPFDGTYYCKLCDFENTQRDEFHVHIINHRDISTDYQCMECGECFVVKPSLIKHLMHYHKIEDTESYFESNECYDKNAVKNLKEIMNLAPGESREPVKENQCRVCLQEFSDNKELKTHFRIHGMAFLMKNSRD